MSSKIKTILRGISILIVLLIVMMQLGVITIHLPVLNENRIWITILAYGLLLITIR